MKQVKQQTNQKKDPQLDFDQIVKVGWEQAPQQLDLLGGVCSEVQGAEVGIRGGSGGGRGA